MMLKGVLEDVGAIVGTEAALRLAGWQDGKPVYIPTTATVEHKLCAILAPDDPADTGADLLRRLCVEYGGETLCLPKAAELDYMRKRGHIARLLRQGVSVRCIAHAVGLSERQVINQRRWLEEAGLLPYILREPPTREQLELLFGKEKDK